MRGWGWGERLLVVAIVLLSAWGFALALMAAALGT